MAVIEAAKKSAAKAWAEKKSPVVISVQNITRKLPLGRKHIEIVKGMSFEILNGEFVSIVGPSGSGLLAWTIPRPGRY